jgi:hypothetical protein
LQRGMVPAARCAGVQRAQVSARNAQRSAFYAPFLPGAVAAAAAAARSCSKSASPPEREKCTAEQAAGVLCAEGAGLPKTEAMQGKRQRAEREGRHNKVLKKQ